MTENTALMLITVHFVADFLFQSDWMALNKSKRWDALALHVVTYTAVLLLLVGWTTNRNMFTTFIFVNAAAHFIQDAITSRITLRLWFFEMTQPDKNGWFNARLKPTRHWFFVVIGFDQLLHYITLFVTAGWWLQ